MKVWRSVVAAALLLALGLAAAPPAQAAGRTVRIQLREEGGFAGLQDRVTVYKDGCVRLSRRTGPTVDKCLTAGEVRKLKGYLKKLSLGRSQKPPQGADFIKYTLTYKGHRVSKYTLTKTWRPVVAHLEKILQKYWAPD
ncbi:hypothetical protein [Nonomuraea soli]|uniref:Uncharacterized protein n=1 Tax=Nonomuraea soli TaxID=1032476 RepID=A0A7W0CI64_9ACTN|nr:hypothetical protein [Nonomuraea soli]MBA2891672.1 hypothetical protein [Nonomuraea soli]